MGRTSDADQRLMDAVLSLIWEQSYGVVTIDDICQKAGVKKGSFYYFFDSKSDLVVAALGRHWEKQKLLWDNQFSPTIAPRQRIRNHCDALHRRQTALKERTGRVPGCLFCALGSEICQQDEAIRTTICDILGMELKYWESAISDAQREEDASPGDVAEKARCASAYVEGFVAQARLRNDAGLLASLGDRVCELVFGGRSSPHSENFSDTNAAPDGTEAVSPERQTADADEFDPTKY